MIEEPAPRRWTAGQIARTTALVTSVVAALAMFLVVFWLASTAVLAVAVGVLLAVLLDAGARGLGRLVPLSRHVRLLILFFIVAVLIIAAFWWGGTVLTEQANNFYQAMKSLIAQANTFLESGRLGFPLGTARLTDLLPSGGTIFGGARTVASATFDALTLSTAILFLGAFFAWEPSVYKGIVLSLIPHEKRERVDEVLDMAGHAMREWLIGQSVSMILIFLFSLFALLLVGMPYPVLLAVQAGLLTFIPTVGPFIAGVIIILAGLSQSLVMAAYGLATYVLIQFLESNLVTPVVQERTIRLPPAATLALQLVAAFLFGLIGVAFIVPLSAAGKVIIQELYVKDRLGGPWETQEEPSALSRWIDRVLKRLRGR